MTYQERTGCVPDRLLPVVDAVLCQPWASASTPGFPMPLPLDSCCRPHCLALDLTSSPRCLVVAMCHIGPSVCATAQEISSIPVAERETNPSVFQNAERPRDARRPMPLAGIGSLCSEACHEFPTMLHGIGALRSQGWARHALHKWGFVASK